MKIRLEPYSDIKKPCSLGPANILPAYIPQSVNVTLVKHAEPRLFYIYIKHLTFKHEGGFPNI